MPITILPWGRFPIPEIEEMPFKADKCSICDMYFTDMSDRVTINEHEDRCVRSQVEERKKMIAMGYKLTSKGWIKE